MIPISSKEHVEYKDKDGVVFLFKPKGGLLERELFDIYSDSLDYRQRMAAIDALIDKILLAPKYDKSPSEVFNSDEKAELIKFWNEANKLTREEKKS